jgi:hypothetical protein
LSARLGMSVFASSALSQQRDPIPSTPIPRTPKPRQPTQLSALEARQILLLEQNALDSLRRLLRLESREHVEVALGLGDDAIPINTDSGVGVGRGGWVTCYPAL